jgi:hypothetical protein
MRLSLDSVDAIIIFHHEWKALKNCATSFRTIYPDGKLFIARDHLPMKHIERLNHLNPNTISTYSTTEFFIQMVHNNETLTDISRQEFINKVEQDLQRMEETLNQCENKYLLYLEADSLVLGKTMITDDFDMDSLAANPYPKVILNYIQKISGTKMPINGWGFVTGLIKVSAAKTMIKWARENHNLLLEIFEIDRRFIYLDYFAPILMHLSGGKVINSGSVGECLRDKNWKKRNYTLVHQVRTDY